MDIKPYERYKTDIAPEEEKKKQLENYTDFQKAVLQSLENYTAPKKPVKWFLGKDKEAKMVGLETLHNVLRPTEMAIKTFLPATDSQTGRNHLIIILINLYVSLEV